MTNKNQQVQSLLWQAMTPVHPGTGQVSASVIDLPVAREGATGFPVLPASSIKGVLRDGDGLRDGDADSQADRVVRARKYFGYADQTAQPGAERSSAAGDLSFTDARLLALSVPSFQGTFALVTCPMILSRLSRDRQLLGLSALPALSEKSNPKPQGRDITNDLFGSFASLRQAAPAAPAAPTAPTARISTDSVLVYTTTRGQNTTEQVILQDLDFTPAPQAIVDTLAQLLTTGLPDDDAQMIRQRLCVIDDDLFAFLSETATEVTAHVQLDPDQKTVQKGMLWYEETIPAETLFSSFVLSRTGEGLTILGERPYLQVGGKGSVGRGLLRVVQGDRA